jgi:hypothetical protein
MVRTIHRTRQYLIISKKKKKKKKRKEKRKPGREGREVEREERRLGNDLMHLDGRAPYLRRLHGNFRPTLTWRNL